MKKNMHKTVLRVLRIINRLTKQVFLVLPLPTKKEIVFWSDPDVSDNSFAIFQYLIERFGNKWSYCWVVGDIETSKKIIARDCPQWKNVSIRYLSKRSWLTWYYTRLCQLSFDTHGAPYEKKKFYPSFAISLWHGSPLKAIGNVVEPGLFRDYSVDLLCSAHPCFNDYFVSGLSVKKSSIINIGYPRNDWLTGALRSYCPDFIVNKKFVVWMPTYSTSIGSIDGGGYQGRDSVTSDNSLGCVSFDDLKIVDDHLGKLGLFMIIKLHSYDLRNYILKSMFTNIKVLGRDDLSVRGSGLYGILSRSEALISDCSSVIFDYMLTGKRIAIDTISLKNFSRKFNFKFDPDEEGFDSVSDLASLCGFLESVAFPRTEAAYRKDKYNIVTRGSFCEELVKVIQSTL